MLVWEQKKSIALLGLLIGLLWCPVWMWSVQGASLPVVTNPGFETAGPVGWAFFTSTDPPPDFQGIYPPNFFHTGLQSAEIVVLNAEVDDWAYWQQTGVTPVLGGVTYNLSAWIWIQFEADNLLVDIGVIWQDGVGTQLGSAFTPARNSPSGVWFENYTIATAPVGTTQASIQLRVRTQGVLSGVDIFFDDVEFYPLGGTEVGGNSPPDHGAYYDPDADPYNEMLQLNITASQEGLDDLDFTLDAWGSGNDSQGISEVDIVYDSDGDGVYNATSETIIASGTYSQDNGTLQLNTTHSIPKGESHLFLIVYQISLWVTAGETYACNVSQIVAVGQTTQSVVGVLGTPIMSSVKTIIGSLVAGSGAGTPADHDWTPDGVTLNILLQLELYAHAEDFLVFNVSLTASGTLNDAVDILSIHIIHDENADGLVNTTEPILGTGNFTQDNGSATIVLYPPLNISKWSTENILVGVVIATTAAANTTLRLTVTALGTTGSIDSSSNVGGTPQTSAEKTIYYPIGSPIDLLLMYWPWFVLGGAVIIVVIVYFYRYRKPKPPPPPSPKSPPKSPLTPP